MHIDSLDWNFIEMATAKTSPENCRWKYIKDFYCDRKSIKFDGEFYVIVSVEVL